MQALPGPPTADRSGAYVASLTVTASTFEFFIRFTAPDAAAMADELMASDGWQVSAWPTIDAAGNTPSLTIAGGWVGLSAQRCTHDVPCHAMPCSSKGIRSARRWTCPSWHRRVSA